MKIEEAPNFTSRLQMNLESVPNICKFQDRFKTWMHRQVWKHGYKDTQCDKEPQYFSLLFIRFKELLGKSSWEVQEGC